MMNTANSIIEQILSANKLEDVISHTNWKVEYKRLLLLIHPDVCGLPDAALATARLNTLRERFEKGVIVADESGGFQTNGYKTIYSGNPDLLHCSFQNYKRLKSTRSCHFLKYIPEEMYWDSNCLIATHTHRAIPLSQQSLPQKHVNWILSRLLEFTALLYEQGYTHCGLNPESVFVVPETHGIQVTSFYHLTLAGRKITTINGQYKNWYPAALFNEKRAVPCIDLELAKKTAIYLLGDTSGSGIKLRKSHNAAFIDFVISQTTDPAATYQQYRALLKRNFKNAFHILNL